VLKAISAGPRTMAFVSLSISPTNSTRFSTKKIKIRQIKGNINNSNPYKMDLMYIV
jgi:hypothetical protein